MKNKKIIDNLLWTLEATPQRYDKREWIVYSEDYGIFSKKEAEILASLLRRGVLLSIVNKSLKEG